MSHLSQSRKTIFMAAFMSIITISFVSSSQAGALSLNDILKGISSGSQQNQVTNNSLTTSDNSTSTNKTTQTTTQPATQTDTTPQALVPSLLETVTQQAPSPSQQSVQPTTSTSVTPKSTVAPSQTTSAKSINSVVAIKPVDTSLGVIATANAQSVGASAANVSPYKSNKLDPERAQQLLYVGIASITAGILIYAATSLPLRKQTNNIPVKSV